MKVDHKEAAAAIEDLKAGNVRGVESAIRFLKSDVYEFRSGYLKEYLWRYLARVSLTERQKERLLAVARKYLERQITREFWQMCRLISQIADPEFTEYVKNLAESAKHDDVRQRAALLAAYLLGLGEGEKTRRRFNRRVRYGQVEVTSDEA
jgi:hypothetical protein